MKQILIIRREQFGYHTDIFKWCLYLRDRYDVSTISFDCKKNKVTLDHVKTHYVSIWGSRLIRGILFLLTSCWYILRTKGVIIVSYFPDCAILKRLLPWKKMILDVRTMDVNRDLSVRERANARIRAAAKIFDYCTPISKGVGDQLMVTWEKISVLPLGADCEAENDKSFNSINLLYIGTFFNRNLEKTLYGLSKALKESPISTSIHYDIVGDGRNGEMEELKKITKELSLDSIVKFHGYIQHNKLTSFFNKCNVGVSFVPQTPFFEYQPVTKTFEYALSGLYTIGTSTYANREIINEDNGILIQDNEDSFADAIMQIIKKKDNINSSKIRATLQDYRWDRIVDSILVPIIEKNYK